MAKNYVRLDKVNSDAYIDTIVAETEVINSGQFVVLGKLKEGEPEVTEFTKAEEGKLAKTFAASVDIDYGYHDYDPTDQSTPVGKAVRVFHIAPGMIISINKELASGIVVGDNVTVGANGLGFKKAGVDDAVIGKAIAIDTLTNVGDVVVVRF